MMWIIPCEVCGKDNHSLNIVFPIEAERCSECGRPKTPERKSVTFCSWKCMKVWLDKKLSEEKREIEDKNINFQRCKAN